MDETQREALNALFDAKVKERDQLNGFLGILARELGRPVPNGPGDETHREASGALSSAALHGDPAAAVREGQYFGLSAPKAAKALLERFGRERPMKTDEIFAAITKGGVKIGSAATLYRSLSRDKTFFRVGRRRAGRWGLAEWYPAGVRARTVADGLALDDAYLESSSGE
jgi:hypothetical protein